MPPPNLRSHPTLLTAAISGGRFEIVVRRCPLAASMGIYPGMTLAEARAMLGDRVLILPFDAYKSHAGLVCLARWCVRFSPVVSLDPAPTPLDDHAARALASLGPLPADGLLMDITGAGHLFGGEPLMLYEIVARLRRVGFTARVAAAPTIGAAWALARFADSAITMVGESSDGSTAIARAISVLPIGALRIDSAICHQLAHIGIDRIAHLLALSREGLAARFGDAVLRRVDQSLGRIPEMIEPLRPEKEFVVERIFEGAATQGEAIEQATQELIEQLCEKLAQAESGTRGVELRALRADSPPACVTLSLGRPTRKAKHLWSLLRPKIETIQVSAEQAALEKAETHLTFGVEALRLRATWAVRMRHEQIDAWEDASDHAAEEELAELLDTLTSRLGAARVMRMQPMGSHLPERATRLVDAVEDAAGPAKDRNAKGGVHVSAPPFASEPGSSASWLWGLFIRPPVLFEAPEPAEAIALEPDHPPARLFWRGEFYEIVSGEGPERIAAEWWIDSKSTARTDHNVPPSLQARDYYKLQTRGGLWLWTFRETARGKWFVHGAWT